MDTPPSPPPPRARLALPVVQALAVVLMLGSKAGLVIAGRVPFNADEAIVALMARHILAGARPVFFYGQAYMGSLDAYLVAGGFAALGEQVWVIRLVQALLYTGVLLTTARLGKLIFNSAWNGALAALLLAIPTVNVTLYTTASLGGYGETLLIGNLILLTSLSLRRKIVAGEPAPGLWLFWGFFGGLGLWAFGLSLVYSLPAGIYLLAGLARRQAEKHFGPKTLVGPGIATLAGFGLGAAPWLGYATQHGLSELLVDLGGRAYAGGASTGWLAGVLQHLVNLFLLGFSVIFGLRPPWRIAWLALPLLPLALALWLFVLGFSAARLRRGEPPAAERWLLVGVMVTLLAAFIFSPFGADPTGRYFLPLAIPLALFAAEMLTRTGERRPILAAGLLALVLSFNLWGTLQCALDFPPGLTTQFTDASTVDHRSDQALADFLRSQGETTGYTNYWVAYPLAFLSQESLIFSPQLPYNLDLSYTPGDDRYPVYTAQIAQAPRTAYITTHNPALDAVLVQGFSRLGVSWQEAQIGDYHIYYQLSRPLHPAELERQVEPWVGEN